MNQGSVLVAVVSLLTVQAPALADLGPGLEAPPVTGPTPETPFLPKTGPDHGPEVTFEENAGQYPDAVRFRATGADHPLLLLEDGFASVLPDPLPSPEQPGQVPAATLERTGHVLTARFQGAAPQAIEPVGTTSTLSHHLTGQDPAGWATGVPHAEQVRYHQLYPGVDMLVYATPAGLVEYDLLVAPGADPGQVRLGLAGQDTARVDEAGALVLETPAGTLTHQAPVAHQILDGAAQPVAAAFTLEGDTLGFELGEHDTEVPVVIDPVIVASTRVGGTGDEHPASVESGPGGLVYVTGVTTSPDLPDPLVPGASTWEASWDGFITVHDPVAATTLARLYYGGSSVESVIDAEIGPATGLLDLPLVHLAGSTRSSDLPTTPGALQEDLDPANPDFQVDGFLAVLEPLSGTLLAATYVGGPAVDYAAGLAVGPDGSTYLTGTSLFGRFPTTEGAFQERYPGGGNSGWIAHLDPQATELVWSTYLGGDGGGGFGQDFPRDIALSPTGQVWAVGRTSSANFPLVDPVQDTRQGKRDVFVSLLSGDGSELAFSTYLGGSSGDEHARDLAVLPDGSAVVTGRSNAPDWPTTAGALQPDPGGGHDAFVARFPAGGGAPIFSTLMGADGGERNPLVDIGPGGTVVVVLDGGSGLATTDPTGRTGPYLTQLTPDGSQVLYSTHLEPMRLYTLYFKVVTYSTPYGGLDVGPLGEVLVAGWQPGGSASGPLATQCQGQGGTDVVVTRALLVPAPSLGSGCLSPLP